MSTTYNSNEPDYSGADPEGDWIEISVGRDASSTVFYRYPDAGCGAEWRPTVFQRADINRLTEERIVATVGEWASNQ